MKSNCFYRGLLAIAMLWIQIGYAQFTKAEYFFDTDPGAGNGTVLMVSVTPGVEFDLASFNGSIPVPTNMAVGWHQLYVRFFDATKGWGLHETKPFWVLPSGTPFDKLEYFFDNDPGAGNGTALGFQSAGATTGTFNGNVSTSGLAPGPHILFLRAKHKNGLWGMHAQQAIAVLPGTNSIEAAEYFFDTDPGAGNGTALTVTGVTGGGNVSASIPTSGLKEGFHILYVRTKGVGSGWSLMEGKPIFVKPVIQQAEWYVDTDPGVGNGTAITIEPGNPAVNFAGDITLPGCLSAGEHTLFIRARSADGQWGLHDQQTFTIDQTPAALAFTTFPTVMNQCPGNAFDVAFTTSGNYNEGNIFTIQLSNASGNFETPVTIGTLEVAPSGCQVLQNISVTIPDATPDGTGYRIRIISSLPVQQADSAENITIQPGNTYYRDADGDGYGNEFETTIACALPPGYVENADDCDDTDAGVYEGIRYYIDADGDGYGTGTGELICASAPPPGYAENNTDCDDTNDTVFELKTFYADTDRDGFGAGPVVMLCANTAPAGYSVNNTDCDDNDALVNTPQLYYVDADGDGFGTGTGVMLCAASAPTGYATNNTDCDDLNPLVHQPLPYFVDADGDGYGAGGVVMLCTHIAPAGYSVNNTDCNDADPLVHTPQRYYIDADGDGFGTGEGELICIGTVPEGYSANNEDCNDADPLQKPGQVWFTDADGDGYATGTSVTQCLRPTHGKLAAELTATSGDCDDNNPLVNPLAQTITFSGNAGYETAFISPTSGTPYTTFNFEVNYTDATNSLPPYGYPRVLLDFEGNGNYTGNNDRTIVMSSADVTDNNTADGKIYRGSISQLATGTNWKSKVLVVNGSCSTQTDMANYPIVRVLPDLEIFANDIVFSASNPPVSSPLTVTAKIYNRSDFAAENFVARLINQYSPEVDYGDIVVASIAPNSSTTVTWNITTPAEPAWCPMQVYIDATNLIDETNELNNTALRPFTNGNYNVPGAIEVTASASPEVSYPTFGATVNISGKAIYTGTAVPLVDPSVAGAQVEITLVETGQTFMGITNSRGNYSINIPRPTTIGTYHVEGTITDFTLTGNLSAEFTLVTAPCQPDLTSRIVLSANQLVEGQSLNAAFTITNNGCAPAAATQMFINQTGGSPSTMGQFEVPALAPGATFTRTVNNFVFATRGNYGFSLTADVLATEIEQSESNNISYANVNVLPNLPDLSPYDGTRGNYQFCNTLPTSISYILRNSGGVASGAFTTQVKVYFNGDFIETLTHNVPGIAAQSLYSFSLPYVFGTIGTYNFEVLIDVPHPDGIIEEVSEANNTAIYTININACPPPVANLVLLGESCQRITSLDPVDPQFPGTMTLTARAHNAGNLTAAGPIEVRFSLSNGASYTGSYAGNLAPGQTVNVSVTVPTVAPATTTLLTRIDPNNLVAESNEADNETGPESLCWNFRPALWCESATWNRKYVVNQTFLPRIEVVAEGLYHASQVKVRFEVSGPGILGKINLGDAILLNPRRVCAPFCNPVASLPSNFVFQEEGVYTFIMTVDPDDDYTECSEGDNVMNINVTVVDQPDMRILSQYINPSKLNPDVNEPVDLLVTYENIGVSNITDRMKLKVLVDEIELATVSNVAGLISGDKATIAIPVPWSSSLVGAHIIRAIIDSDNTIAESNELNNEATRAIIVGALANLRFNSFASSNAFPAVGDAITLNATIWNDGDEATDGEVEFLYINTNGDSIQIGKLPVSVLAGGTQNIQLPWFVPQTPANLVARIINATMLEATYDDNVATAAIGNYMVTVNTEAACGESSNGKLTAVVSGGTAPFSYEWSNGATGAQLNALAGTYTVIVTDANGLTTEAEGTITVITGTTYYADADGDGFGSLLNSVVSCTGAPVGYVSNNLDCDDADPSITIPRIWYRDADNDGYSNGNTLTQCERPTDYKLASELIAMSIDCNDNNAAVNPGATEVCNGIDDDCDGVIDEGCEVVISTWYRDVDGDGFGRSSPTRQSQTQPIGFVDNADDCNDRDATIYPGAPELPDGKDNNCNGEVDEGLDCRVIWYRDVDGDGFGRKTPTKQSCIQPIGFVDNADDCNDRDATIYPSAPELPDGKDNNCNGEVDEGLDCRTVWYRDVDGDGYGRKTPTKQSCIQPIGFVDNADDCNDRDATIYPGAPELPDGKDNNCNGEVDEDLECRITWYRDVDGDGYGRKTPTIQSCIKPNGYVDNADDCNDHEPTIYLGAPELPDGKDNNCDGQIDEGLECRITWYRDADGDGYGRKTPPIQSCIQPLGHVNNSDDCNDNDPTIYPGAPEMCDGKDNNCNGKKDEGCVLITSAEDSKRNNANKSIAKVPESVLEVSLWPNPASTEVMLSLNNFEPNKKVEIVMLTVDGRSIQSQSLIPQTKGQQARFDVRGLGAGFYLIRVQQGILTETKRVVVVR
jgi:subtilase family serine protease